MMELRVGEYGAKHYRAFLDGVEVTDRCYAANDEEGWADVYKADAAGKWIMDADGPVMERLHGQVQFVRRDSGAGVN